MIPRWATGTGAAALAVASAVIYATTGNVVWALAPWVLAGGVLAALGQPLHRSVLCVVFLLMVAESPQDKPADGLWQSPLYPLGLVLLTNFSKSIGLPAPFSGLDVIAALLCFVAVKRRWEGRAEATPGPLWWSSAVGLGAIVLWIAWGVARGGQPGPVYWQVRQLIYIPIFALLLQSTLRVTDLATYERLFIAAALVKAAVGSYFYFVIALPRGLEPAYVTTHADTLLFVGAALLLFSRWLNAPGVRTFRALALLSVPLLLAMVINDRRIAYVALAAGMGTLFLMAPWTRAKRHLLVLGVALAPVGALYVAAGWSSEAAVFKPVAAFRTILDSENDSSTQARDIENFNLAQTIVRHPWVGTGFGHPYGEFETAADLSDVFGLFKFIPHNSVLWLLAIGGVFGFVALLAPLVAGTFLAARSGHSARTPLERATAHWLTASILVLLIQLWGDMGTQCWTAVALASSTFALAGKLALANGGWPLPQAAAMSTPVPLLRSI